MKALFVCVAVVALGGCGESSESASVSAVSQAYREWDDAAIAGDAKTACARMTPKFVQAEVARAGATPKTCEGLIKGFSAFARKHPEVKNYKLSDVDVFQNRATLTDRTPYENAIDTARIVLLRIDGRWMIDSQQLIENAPQEAPSVGGLES